MKLCEILNEGSILLPVKSTQQNDAIQELLNHLQKMGYLSTTAKLYTDMEAHEKKQSTATGRGVSFPHCTSTEVDELICIFGISQKGVDYSAPDGQLCHFIVLTLSPLNEPNLHRKFISKFRSMINYGDIRTQFLDAPNAASIFSIIDEWEIEDASSEGFE
jgi:mannitol/fructose-specific phosphotransferase system IIA component (Ntr-type)